MQKSAFSFQINLIQRRMNTGARSSEAICDLFFFQYPTWNYSIFKFQNFIIKNRLRVLFIMAIRKKCPQIYWSQTDSDVNLMVDLLLDDMVCVEQTKMVSCDSFTEIWISLFRFIISNRIFDCKTNFCHWKHTDLDQPTMGRTNIILKSISLNQLI